MTLLIVVALVAGAVLCAAPLVRVCDRQAGWPLAAAFVAAAVVLGRRLPEILDGRPLTLSVTWVRDFLAPGMDIEFSLRADALGAFFTLLALSIGAVVFVYSAAYLPRREGTTSFYLIMTAFTLAVVLLVLADDAVVLFISWELVSIASFLLIARSGSSGEAGSQRTLILTFIGGLTFLVALSISAVYTGTTNLTTMLASPVWGDNHALTVCVALLIATSAFTKSAQLPFHFWLPEAMAAATPVSAFLHAAAVVKAGIYVLLRFSTVFHDVAVWNGVLITVGIVTAIMSAVFAVQKTDLKKLTAYSTVSHLGWIVATIGIGTPFALGAAIVHTAAHALFKSSLFMLIGVIDHENGTRDIRRLGKIWRKMPWTFGSVVIGALSMAAVPPLFGFISKEGMLTAFEAGQSGPLSTGATWALLLAAGFGALATFTYSAKFVFGAFLDGSDNPARNNPDVHEAPLALWLPAALPGVLSLPLGLCAGLFDQPVDRIVGAITADPHSAHTHLALWHGWTVPLAISLVVLAVGVAGLWLRGRLWPALEERELLPTSGNALLAGLQRGATALGRLLGAPADSLNPSRHLIWPFLCVIAIGAAALLGGPGVDGVALAPRADGLDNPLDLGPLLIVGISVVGLCATRHRITAAVLIGTTGVGITLQMLLLGAPDVALTQFLVESLTVVILMLVIRYHPPHFHPVPTRRKVRSAVVALAAGATAFGGVFALLGRHGRSELAQYYIDNGPDITGGQNVVATIIVEFRALDTLGELSVLGMAAIVIGSVVASFPREPFAKGTRPRPFGQSQLNSLPLKKGLVLVVPLMALLSLLAFMRGHADPGGGFVAALIAGTGVMMAYMAKGRDAIVFRPSTPYLLTGIGIVTALSAGFVGLTQGSFLTPIYGHIFGEHVTTSAIFDGGIYLAVLGMLTSAVNSLGGYLKPGVTHPEELEYYRTDGPLPATAPVPVDDPEAVDIPFPEPLNPNPRGEADFGPDRAAANASAASGLLLAWHQDALSEDSDTEFPEATEHYEEHDAAAPAEQPAAHPAERPAGARGSGSDGASISTNTNTEEDAR